MVQYCLTAGDGWVDDAYDIETRLQSMLEASGLSNESEVSDEGSMHKVIIAHVVPRTVQSKMSKRPILNREGAYPSSDPKLTIIVKRCQHTDLACCVLHPPHCFRHLHDGGQCETTNIKYSSPTNEENIELSLHALFLWTQA